MNLAGTHLEARPRAGRRPRSNRFETSVAARITDGSVITVGLMGRISGAPPTIAEGRRRVFNFSWRSLARPLAGLLLRHRIVGIGPFTGL